MRVTWRPLGERYTVRGLLLHRYTQGHPHDTILSLRCMAAMSLAIMRLLGSVQNATLLELQLHIRGERQSPDGADFIAERVRIARLSQPQEHSQRHRFGAVAHWMLSQVLPCRSLPTPSQPTMLVERACSSCQRQ